MTSFIPSAHPAPFIDLNYFLCMNFSLLEELSFLLLLLCVAFDRYIALLQVPQVRDDQNKNVVGLE
jgi:hypothetical protein